MADAMPFRKVHFPSLVEAVGYTRALDVLGVHPRTLNRYITARAPVPQMARAALWPLSHWGRSIEVVELENQVRILSQLADLRELEIRKLEAEIRRLTKMIDWQCANDPMPARLMA